MGTSFKQEMNAINYLILKNLYSSRKKSPIICCKFEPSNQLAKYLKQHYCISNKFMDGSSFLKDHCFEIVRFFNENDYSTIYINNDGKSSFKIKLTKPRKLNFLNNALEKKSILYKNILHLKFTVDDKKVV